MIDLQIKACTGQLEAGDVVRTKSLAWYYEHENGGSVETTSGVLLIPEMVKFLDKEVKIVQKLGADRYKIEGCEFYWTSDMFDLSSVNERIGEFILLSKDGKHMMGHVFPTPNKAKEFLGLRTDYVVRELVPLK